MIQIKLLCVEQDTAILAGIFVPLENVLPGELDLLLWQAVILA